MLITQDLSQHQGVYGTQESITANCHVRIAFAANKPETAELLSQMAGDTTVSHKQVSYRGGSLMMGDRSTTQQEIRRRLLTPDEAMRLDPDHGVVFVAGQQPMYAGKSRYFQDRELSRRASLAAPASSGRTGRCATAWGALPPASSAVPPAANHASELSSLASALDRERAPEDGVDRQA